MYVKRGNTMKISTKGRYALEIAADLAMHSDHEHRESLRNIARLTSPTVNKLAVLDSLVGIVPADDVTDDETIREERLARQ